MKKPKDFHFKKFIVKQDRSAHKVGTDGVLLGAWVDVAGCDHILDVGTGTGIIALMIAQRTGSNVMIDAVEVHPDDASEARENFEASAWRERLNVYQRAFQEYHSETQYDLIVSNPPFFNDSLLPPSKSRARVRHSEELSFAELISYSKNLLKAEGRLAIILPPTEALQFIHAAIRWNLFCCRRCDFRSRKDKPIERVLLEFSGTAREVKSETLILYEHSDIWSEAYRRLVGDFYLKG